MVWRATRHLTDAEACDGAVERFAGEIASYLVWRDDTDLPMPAVVEVPDRLIEP